MTNRQMTILELLPDDAKRAVRDFQEASYKKQDEDGDLAPCRNRYEAYGLLASEYTGLLAAMKGVKSAMEENLNGLAGGEQSYRETADLVYSALTDVSIAAVAMAVQALNVISAMMRISTDAPTPLEQAAEDAEDGTTGRLQGGADQDTDAAALPEEV